MSPFIPTHAAKEARVSIMERGMLADRKKKRAPTLTESAPDICAHRPLPPPKKN